ncbi:uncharacterized protein beat-Vc isoform X2 [Drosophila bipectinata]|uniref:uncharacterized protein beat-Vc isoform X2 n=1 Tax=Drosophila bipectinata TaxID=42026 RepID=UPI0038B4151F
MGGIVPLPMSFCPSWAQNEKLRLATQASLASWPRSDVVCPSEKRRSKEVCRTSERSRKREVKKAELKTKQEITKRKTKMAKTNRIILPKLGPFITGWRHAYKYRDTLLANCSSDWSSPASKLMWYINNKTVPGYSLQPQINEVTRNTDGLHLFISHLQLRLPLEDQRFISKSEVLELRCTADIMGLASVRRESRVRTTVLALKDAGYNQRLTENGSCINGQPASLAAWLLGIVHFLRWHGTQS